MFSQIAFIFEEVLMDSGMLWFDNSDQRDLDSKIDRAAAYFLKKYGQSPTICFVHPSMLQPGADGSSSGEVEVRSAPSVLPNHFWIGMKGQNAAQSPFSAG